MISNRVNLLQRVLFSVCLVLACSKVPEYRGEPPNILLIVMDAARADHFSCYGYQRETTPAIDKLALSGALFSRAVSSTSWTVPSHASLFTGLLPPEHGATYQHDWLVDRIPTLAELLKAEGYRSAAFSSNPAVDRSNNLHRGFDLFISVWSDTTRKEPVKHFYTERTNGLIRSFIENGREDPFFIFVNYMDVHTPYDPPEPYRSRYLPQGTEITVRIDSACHNEALMNYETLTLSAEEISAVCDIYDGALNYLDAKIGELLEYLGQKGILDNTLIIITSDHGDLLGEYGFFGHGGLLSRLLVQIPLVIRYPPIFPRQVVRDEPVAIADIFHSIASLLPLKGYPETGAPVRNLFSDEIEPAPCYSDLKVGAIQNAGRFLRNNDTRSVWTPEDLHYILSDDESYECYDLDQDSGEARNLCPAQVDRKEVVSTITKFEKRLFKFVEIPEDLRLLSRQTLDPEQIKALKALGYVGHESRHSSFLSDIREHPHVIAHLKSALFFLHHDSTSAAEQELRTALSMSPDNTFIRKRLGTVLYLNNKFEEAVLTFRPLIGDTDQETQISLIMGIIFIQLEKYDEALEQFQKAIELHPMNFVALINLAEVFMKIRDCDSAELYIQKILTAYKGSFPVLLQVVRLYLYHDYSERACQLLLAELDKSPSGIVNAVLAQVCRTMGRDDEADYYLKKAISMGVTVEGLKRIKEYLSLD